MASKRSRAVFEGDSYKVDSPYVFYGSPLQSQDPGSGRDGSYVPLWQQEVRDSQGRRRLHGAFTGGYSAGYYNTVGSKEGWTPSTFVSSRSERRDQSKHNQTMETFMDDEDMADAENAKVLRTSNDYAGLGRTEDDSRRRAAFLGISRPSSDARGVRLLKRMGWRPEQSKRSSGILSAAVTVTTGPSAGKKTDLHGLGYMQTASPLNVTPVNRQPPSERSANLSKPTVKISLSTSPSRARSGFGVGVLNDSGSDEEDPYEMGPRKGYRRLAPNTRKKDTPIAASSGYRAMIPSGLQARPIFVKRKDATQYMEAAETSRRGFHGTMSLAGFVLGSHPEDGPATFPPPVVPVGWRSTVLSHNEVRTTDAVQSHVRRSLPADLRLLNPSSRSDLLGEQQLPGKSVFDFLSPAARTRLANASGRFDLPPAGDELGCTTSPKRPEPTILDVATARSALTRLSSSAEGPYADDSAKRARYITFLRYNAGDSDREEPPIAETNFTNNNEEISEFAQAARVFRPVSSIMAGRFTTSAAAENGVVHANRSGTTVGETADAALEAVRAGMFGPLTRRTSKFSPTRLLCKRFNVPFQDLQTTHGEAAESKEIPSQENQGSSLRGHTHDGSPNNFRREFVTAGAGGSSLDALKTPSHGKGVVEAGSPLTVMSGRVDTGVNTALEQARPGVDIFRAIFGSDDEASD